MSLSESAFLFVDVDGYCAGGVDQRTIVSAGADGYRARELGWAFYTATDHAAGSVYFRDEHGRAALSGADPSVAIVRRLHGLPVAPGRGAFRGEVTMCASRLLDALVAVHDAVATATGLPVVLVHKGGNEGVWAGRALPGVAVIDLGLHGCPRVDAIARGDPAAHAGRQCPHHDIPQRRGGRRSHRGVIHCPRLEVQILAGWVARVGQSRDTEASRLPAPGGEKAAEPGR